MDHQLVLIYVYRIVILPLIGTMSAGITTVMILGLNGRRYSLKVTPNTSILQVLEEACLKQGVSPGDYDLKHGNKILDLSLSLRFANLPNNAMLELQPADKIRKEANVTVGVQLESGERLMGDFSPSCSVWDVVYQCLSQRENPERGDNGSRVPFCVYMHQMMSEEEMREKTLRSLGLTRGNAVFRLLYREAEQLQQQAHVSSPLTKSTTESAFSEPSGRTRCIESPDLAVTKNSALDKQEVEISPFKTECQEMSCAAPCTSDTSTNNKSNIHQIKPFRSFPAEHSIDTSSDSSVVENINLSRLVSASSPETNQSEPKNLSLEEDSSPEKPMDIDLVSEDLDSKGSAEIGTVTIIGERNAVLYNLNDVATVPKVELPDDFYEITVEDVRYLLAEYKRIRVELENKPLQLQSQKQNENLQRLAQYAKTVVRVQFPDRLVLQGIFSIDETVKSIKEFVEGFLENKELDFYLYNAPPKRKLSPETTLLEAKLFPAANVYFGCEKHLTSYIKPSYLSQLSEPRAANKAAAEFRNTNVSAIPSSLQSIHVDENVNVDIHPQQNLDLPSTSNSSSLSSERSDSKMPKWLKLSKR